MYPQILVPFFLLFIAALAYGWFYWQRAKTRDVSAPSPEHAEEHPAE